MPSPPPSRLEAPSTDESPPPHSALVPGTKASRPPLIPRFCHLGSASDTRSHAGKRARPCLPPGSRRSSRATCHSSTSAIVLTHKHNPDHSRPRRFVTMETTARWVAPTPKSHRQLGFHSSGVTPALSRLRHPHVDLLRQRGFTPNRSTQTPSVAHRCRQRPGIRPLTTTGRIPSPSDDLFRNPRRIRSPSPPQLP
jgi:hypothetical protein